MPAGVEDRVDGLLAQLSLREKLAQLGGAWITDLVDADAFSAQRAARVLANGIGTVTRIGATTGLRPTARAELANAIQRHLVEHTNAGIPAVIHEESTAGFCARDATQFPQAIGLAATWDPELINAMARVIREQMTAVGARHTLAPVLDIARDPRWGRTEETYGESRHLTSRMGVAYVRGMQTDDLRGGVACTGKHFLGYGLSEGGMNHAPVHLGGRELREVFAEPFRATIAEANLATVMNSYASVDGLPCGGSYAILTALLRDELGFDGVVVADYFTIGLLLGHHRIAPNLGRAGEVALRAGLDMELPNTVAYGDPLHTLIERGDVEVALVDRSVRRVLALKLKLGLFEQPYVDDAIAARVYDTPEQRALARELAAASVVVCTNDGVLPIDASSNEPIAVIGPCADDVRLLQGDYSYPAHAEIGFLTDQAEDRGILPSTVAEGTMAAGPYYPPSVTPLAALRELFADVRYERGCALDGHDTSGVAAAVEAARASRVAVVCVGGRSGLTHDSTTGEFRDATSLGLTGPQQGLVDAVLATGTPTVVVLVSGRVHALAQVAERASALVVAWCPGEEGGHGLADVLCGHRDASGRLPITVPRSAGQVPIHHDHRAGGGRSMMLGDYTDAPSAPLFPFGHGLSYTSFEYDRLKLGGRRLDDGIQVRCRVKNTGRRAGIETVQIYLRDDIASLARPDRELCAFTKVALEPGASQVVELAIAPRQLAFYDEAMHFAAEPGSFTVMVGSSATDVRLEGTIKLVA
ncbi:MAG TPA: glycoside hydrolase family 3 N-terminal domain-containing protein [Acidimicrobiia bacterium]